MTASEAAIAVVDIGKTNAKLALVVPRSGEQIALSITPNTVRETGHYPHFDVDRLWDFICLGLSEFRRKHPLAGISITTHGASGALLASDSKDDGLALPILDYEFDGPEELRAEYDAVRPPFAETYSPRLPNGLNLGAQLFWQQRRFTDAFGTARRFVTYPQYWAWRLTGAAATEVTSLGSHTDLWQPANKKWSSLIARAGWEPLVGPPRSAFDSAPIHPDLAKRLGLPDGLPVACGIHDSNASLLPYLLRNEPPFTVISSGTWIIVLAAGGSMDGLDADRDGLANVDAFGDPVPCARFMAGREFERLTGGTVMEATREDVNRVLENDIMATPGFMPGVGPFPRRAGGWTVDEKDLSLGVRVAAASLYCALVTAECMKIAGASGPVIVEGPFGVNRVFCAALSAITGAPVSPSGEGTGTVRGAALLFRSEKSLPVQTRAPVEPLAHPQLGDYVRRWQERSRQA